MSVLDNNNPANEPVPSAKVAANMLLNMTRQTFNQMTHSFNRGAKVFWNNPMGANPQDIANELGTDAAEVFRLHAKLGALLSEVKPDSITEGASVVGNFTVNNDGTVTVLSS